MQNFSGTPGHSPPLLDAVRQTEGDVITYLMKLLAVSCRELGLPFEVLRTTTCRSLTLHRPISRFEVCRQLNAIDISTLPAAIALRPQNARSGVELSILRNGAALNGHSLPVADRAAGQVAAEISTGLICPTRCS